MAILRARAMDDGGRRPSTWVRPLRWCAVGLSALVVLAGLSVGPAPTASAAGTPLVTESFTDASVPDAAWQPLDSACLTRAATAPTAGSTLGVCSSRTNAPAQTTTPGFLQLTDAVTSKRGGVLYNRAIPANGGLEVQFDQYQYGGNGADGIGFFLTSGAVNLTTAGGGGGSLGYAQNNSVPGVNGGYLGVGLDAFGNYSGTGDGKGTGCAAPGPIAGPGARANAIAVRGPGQGTSNYCYLGGTAANAATLRQATFTAGTTGSPQAPLGPAGRTIRITVSPAALPVVTVFMSDTVGGTLTQRVQVTMPSAPPPTYKLGFSASTGGSNDTHLIRNVAVSSVNPLGALNLVKQIDRTTTQPASYAEGSVIPYQFVLTNTSVATLTAVAVTDPRIPAASCPSTTLAANASMTCTGSYRVTASDAVNNTTLVNTATATAREGTNTVTSNTSSVTAPIATPAPALTLVKTARLTDTNANGSGDVGEQVTYSFVATNSGNVTLNGVAVTDPKVTGLAPASTTLAPGASATFTASPYTIQQSDVNAGTALTNTATASGTTTPTTGGSTTRATSASSTATTPVRYSPTLSLAKSGALATGAKGVRGDIVTYSFAVVNTGNVRLTGVSISDTLTGLSALTYTWPGTAGILEIGQRVTATATYALTQANVDAGTVSNSATARGTPPTGNAVTAAATAPVAITATPAITLSKTASPTSVIAAGDVITYAFSSTNTGNVTLSSVAISDPRTGVSALTYTWPGTAGTLAPGQTVTATATYTTTAADVSNGSIPNTATASGTAPRAASATTATASATVSVRPDPVADSVTVVQGQSISFNVLTNDGGAATGASFSRAQLSTTPKAIGGAATPAPASPRFGGVTCVDTGADRGLCTYRSVDYFAGTDTFDYSLAASYQTWNVRVTITVLPANHPPIARPDRMVATTGGTAVAFAPLVNDTDVDGDQLSLVAIGTASRGTVGCSGSSCTYQPPSDGWTGVVIVGYTTADRVAAGGDRLTATSTVTVFVDPRPLVQRGFTDRAAASQTTSTDVWTPVTTIVTAGAASCLSGRPTTTIVWQARQSTTNWILERRLAGSTPGAWVKVAELGAASSSFTDSRLGEGRSYQWQVRPDLQRWPGTFSAPSTAVTQPVTTTARGC